MAVQNRQDNTNAPFILSDDSLVKTGIIQDLNAQRVDPILQYTVLAKVVGGDDIWMPWNAVNGVDGSAVPRGIYLGADIPVADLVDGEKIGCPILVGNATVNENMVVFDQDTLSAESIIGAGTIWAVSGRLAIKEAAGIFFKDTVDISEYEN